MFKETTLMLFILFLIVSGLYLANYTKDIAEQIRMEMEEEIRISQEETTIFIEEDVEKITEGSEEEVEEEFGLGEKVEPEEEQEIESYNETEEVEEDVEESEEKQCPDFCQDLVFCTRDYCNESTNYECVHEEITACIDNDNCCANGCNYENDTDCPVPPIQSCLDGTYYDQCSELEPYYCNNNGVLIRSSDKCFNNICTFGPCEKDSDCDDGKESTVDSCNWNFGETFVAEDGKNYYTTRCINKLRAIGTVDVLTIEFKYKYDPEVDHYYEFYCNEEDCVFRTPEQSDNYFVNWCGENCNIIKKSFFDIFNNPGGITNIYPIGGNEAKYSYYSIYKLKEFYKNESQRYGSDININLVVKGPYILSEKPPQRERPASRSRNTLASDVRS